MTSARVTVRAWMVDRGIQIHVAFSGWFRFQRTTSKLGISK